MDKLIILLVTAVAMCCFFRGLLKSTLFFDILLRRCDLYEAAPHRFNLVKTVALRNDVQEATARLHARMQKTKELLKNPKLTGRDREDAEIRLNLDTKYHINIFPVLEQDIERKEFSDRYI